MIDELRNIWGKLNDKQRKQLLAAARKLKEQEKTQAPEVVTTKT